MLFMFKFIEFIELYEQLMFMFMLFIFDMEDEFREFIGGMPLFMPGKEDIPFI